MGSRSSLTIFAVGIAVLVVGCVSPSTPRTSTAPASDVPTISRTASFATVTASYRSGAYRDALAQIETLSRQPSLSSADRLYLDNQAAICRKALNPTAAPLSLAVPTAVRGAKQTVSDCGPQSLLYLCQNMHVRASLPTLTKAAGTRPGVGSSMAGMVRAASTVGLTATGVQVDADALRRVSPPALAWVDGNHFVAVTGVTDAGATIYDPNKTGKEKIALDILLRRSGGVLLLLSHDKSAATL